MHAWRPTDTNSKTSCSKHRRSGMIHTSRERNISEGSLLVLLTLLRKSIRIVSVWICEDFRSSIRQCGSYTNQSVLGNNIICGAQKLADKKANANSGRAFDLEVLLGVAEHNDDWWAHTQS